MLVPNRHSSSNQYRYGFNGHEKDDELKGEGNSYDMGLRNYDPRVAKMFSVDPRASEYPWQSSYAYHMNSPVKIIDFLGGGDNIVDGEWEINKKGQKVKTSNLGDDVGVDFIHLEDNSTIVEDQKTKQQLTIKPTPDGRSLIKDYLKRHKSIDGWKLYDEFSNGDGPENSLMYGEHPMNLDIMNSPDFINAKKEYYEAKHLNDKGVASSSFGPIGAIRAGFNFTAQFLGKFTASFYPVGDNVVVLINDSKTRNSLRPWLKIPSIFSKEYEEYGNVSRSEPSYRETNDYTNTRQSYLFVLPKSSFRE